MCQFAFQTPVTNRWLVQIVQGPFILLLAPGNTERGRAGGEEGTRSAPPQTVNSDTADWFGLQFWLCRCLTCKSEQSCSLSEAPEVKHINGLGPKRALLVHLGKFAAKPYDAGKPPNYIFFSPLPVSGSWFQWNMKWRESMSVCSCIPVIFSAPKRCNNLKYLMGLCADQLPLFFKNTNFK